VLFRSHPQILKRVRRVYSWEFENNNSNKSTADISEFKDLSSTPRLMTTRPRSVPNHFSYDGVNKTSTNGGVDQKLSDLPMSAPYSSTAAAGGSIGESSSKKRKRSEAEMAFAAASALPNAAANGGVGVVEVQEEIENYRSAFFDESAGEVYEGGWMHGTRHGRGICLYSDGTLYEGQYVFGKEHGRGQMMTGDRHLIYSGDWFDGSIHGYGMYNFPNGDKYSGDFKEGSRHGRGEYIYRNGCKYTGEWRDNKRVGKGIFYWPDNSTGGVNKIGGAAAAGTSFFDGDWEADCRHGRGLLVLEADLGLRYEGSWSNNFMDGRGTCLFPSGQEYQGTFKQGLKEGRGSIRFPEGGEYEGRFKDDRIDGQGTMKLTSITPGVSADERMIPIQIQADLKRIHLKAGFGDDAH